MIWGAMSYGKKYPLVKVDLSEGNLDGKRYMEEILRPHLAKHLNYLRQYGQRQAAVVEDGAPVHWRKDQKKEREKLRINSLPHPAHSPDLNPIENMWSIIKSNLRRRSRIPTSEDELWEAIQQEWEAIPISTINKLVNTMPRRIALVKRNKGFGIPY